MNVNRYKLPFSAGARLFFSSPYAVIFWVNRNLRDVKAPPHLRGEVSVFSSAKGTFNNTHSSFFFLPLWAVLEIDALLKKT